ncbi:hypothetical protein K7X08_001198 [Anisodus acutangulus]|uniref:non-specific serine/threonine protein kinase n=1 Tax=Anisodus acutangulus TaxID=402998 RepID=A0A9Q1MNY5_9SOLA|nr:hypothetical protein K7X08_001198 [Anisodus acutangulus]
MVALNYLSVFFILYFHSAQAQNQTQNNSCPNEFKCGSLGNVSFPFSISSQPACGLYTIDCDVTPNPEIHLGENVYTALNQSLFDNSFQVLDLRLSELLAKNSCQSFDRSPSFPSSPSISFRINERNITLFKCKDSLDINRSTNDHYFRDYQNYSRCSGFRIYYKHPSSGEREGFSDVPEGHIPDNCSLIQLPITWRRSNTENSSLFDLFTAKFRFQWSLSDDCNQCHYEGGRCLTDRNKQFRCSSNPTAKRKSKRILVAAATSSIGGIAMLVVLLLYLRTKGSLSSMIFWKRKREDYRNVKAFLKNHGSLAPRKYSYSEVKKMTEYFKNKLGQGGFGCVYKGKLHNGSLVAVKVLKESKGGGEEFINEVASISRTSHINIVSLVGFCFEGQHRALLYDFMPNGSLEKFIYDAKSGTNRQLGWQALYNISLGIARGLEYLHRGCNTRIVHFDIKPHNILLDEDFCPKISDFGLAKLCNKESIISLLDARGTIGYIAPEIVYTNIGGVSHKSDVYSYGMMVLEMVGGRKNVDVVVDHTSEIYFPHWIYKQLNRRKSLN